MNKDINILVIAGTTRAQRKSIHAARFVAKVGSEIEGVNITFVDPTELNLAGDGNDPEAKDPKYTKMTEDADAFFIVTPEYNHSFPGSLKRVLDSESQNYLQKPVALAGASSGNWGGVRAVESLIGAVRGMRMVVTYTDVYFPRVQDKFDDEGSLLDDSCVDAVLKAYSELIWMAKTLKHGRENIEK